ncbi:MAG: prolyl oligopeptidase family serine peptidase [Gammaproteobacteria bacterium]|nr:prolyl oligopeptidase family serine peptidase [Gammaproteobacteria bacterium]
MRVSPDGNRVLGIATDGQERVLAVSDLATGVRNLALRSGKGQSLDACDWISNERIVCEMFVFGGRPGPPYDRRRVIRLVAVDHDGGDPLPLLKKPGSRPPRLGGATRGAGIPLEDLEHALVSPLPNAPDHALVSASREASPYTTVYRVDTRTGASERVVGWQQGILFWHADWEGEVLIGSGHFSFGPRDFGPRIDEPWLGPTAVVRDAAGLWRRMDVSGLATPIGPRQMASPRILGFSRDGGDVYYQAVVGDDERAALWVGKAATLEPSRRIKADPELDVQATPIGGRSCGVVGFAHPLPESPLTWLDGDLGSAVDAAAQKHGLAKVVAVPSMSDDCRRMVVASSDERTYLRFHLLDVAKGTLRNLGGHDVGVNDRAATERRTVRFLTRDGLSLPMALTLPRAGPAVPPVIVLLGDGSSDDPESLDTWPHFLAARGFAVAQPAIRGYRGYGAKFRMAGLEMRGRRLQEDVADALAWLAEHQHVDGSRACIAGRGRGAHFALVAAVARNDDTHVLPRCAAVYAVLDTRATRRRHGEPLDSRVCGWFPCGDWEEWAAPWEMRRAMRRIRQYLPDRRLVENTLYRTPLAEAEHPGIPILVKSEGRATVHERSTRRFQADVKKTGFFWHIAPEGDAFEAEFLEEAVKLFEEVLRGAEDRSRAAGESVGPPAGADAIAGQ